MSDRRRHRGKHPKDAELFAESILPDLKQAVEDYCYLLSRGYAEKAARKLCGDRYNLRTRQRIAVERTGCADADMRSRKAKCAGPRTLCGVPVMIDGYNLLITIESALSGGVLLRGRDGAIRDLASIHGSYRKVEETIPALHLIMKTLSEYSPGQVTFMLDSPVSNSGRLKVLILEQSAAHPLSVQVELLINPDQALAESPHPVISSDSWILDRCSSWINLAEIIIRDHIPHAEITGA